MTDYNHRRDEADALAAQQQAEEEPAYGDDTYGEDAYGDDSGYGNEADYGDEAASGNDTASGNDAVAKPKPAKPSNKPRDDGLIYDEFGCD